MVAQADAPGAMPGVATTGVVTPGHDKLLHTYLRMAISPDGQWVAAVEGDSPPSGYGPALRDLVIRRVHDGTAVKVSLCALRPGAAMLAGFSRHMESRRQAIELHPAGTGKPCTGPVQRVSRRNFGLRKLLDFNGTIAHLRYRADGKLSMLAIENAVKEVGATRSWRAQLRAIWTSLRQSNALLCWKAMRCVGNRHPTLFVWNTTGAAPKRLRRYRSAWGRRQ